MELNLASALLAIVVFQLFLIAFFLLANKKGKRMSNTLLGIFFLMVGISMLDMWLSFHGLNIYFARIAFIDDGFILALGPLILLYTRSIMFEDFVVRGNSVLHFLPFILITIYFLVVGFLSAPEDQRQLIEDVQNYNLPLVVSLVGLSFYIHSLLYLIKSFSEIREYRARIREEYSSTEMMNVEWLDFTIKSMGILILLAIIHAIVPIGSSKAFAPLSAMVFIGFIFYFANRVILKGLMQPNLFHGISSVAGVKYRASSLTTEERTGYKQKLEASMKTDKPYLDPDLTINQLAEKMDMPSKTLSQVINQSFQKSFFDFINTYRVEEAKELFDTSTDEKMTIQEVMYQSGFNSKSSFNTFFKKLTGQTPSEYRNPRS